MLFLPVYRSLANYNPLVEIELSATISRYNFSLNRSRNFLPRLPALPSPLVPVETNLSEGRGVPTSFFPQSLEKSKARSGEFLQFNFEIER